MVYVFSSIREILTMRLEDMEILSELGRNIYAVRFMGKLEDIKQEKSKLILVITDGQERLSATYFPRIAIRGGASEVGLRRGTTYIFYAHLEPQNKICYVDFFVEADRLSQLRFLTGLFITYFELTFKRA